VHAPGPPARADMGSEPRRIAFTGASGPYGFPALYAAKPVFEKPYGFSAQPSYFALWARRYIHEFGLTERELATIAVSHRDNARLNPPAQRTTRLTIDDYLASRFVSEPPRIILMLISSFSVRRAENS
jgi:acetyl-CoA acetyltransferase